MSREEEEDTERGIRAHAEERESGKAARTV